MIKKLKKLPPLWAMFVFVTVFAFGAFSIGCGDSDTDDQSDDSTADGGDGHDDEDGEDDHDDEDGEDDHDDEDGDDGHDDVGETDVSADSFDDVAAVWAEVMNLKAELDEVISSGKLADVHPAAAAVRDHVKLLADMSHDLSDEAQADLATGISSVASLYNELDEAGDNGRQAETEAANARLQTVLDAIADLYPEGTLK